MLFVFLVLIPFIVLGLILTPLVWCGLGKIFKIKNLTFKKALITCLLLTLIGIAFQGITLGFAFFEFDKSLVGFILSLLGFVVAISLLMIRFNATVLKSIGLHVSMLILAVAIGSMIKSFIAYA